MRRRISLMFFCVLVLALPMPGRLVSGPPDQTGPKIEETWEHTFDDAPGNRQIKVINKTHFVWVTYDRATGRPLALGGGTWKSDGKTYRETPDFGSPGIPQELIGKEQVFDVNIDGDVWLLTGTLTNGVRLRETWRRAH